MQTLRSIVLVIPDLVSAPGTVSFLEQDLPNLRRLAEQSRRFLVTTVFDAPCPEAAWLGLNPDSIRMEQGPLTVAALGADPPDRSVHFRLELMSVVGGVLGQIEHPLSTQELDQLLELVSKLQTPTLAIVRGPGADQGLVWIDGSLDLGTTPPDKATGKTMRSSLPEGDGEPMLRRFIDDASNLLFEAEFNLRRMDEGIEPVNVLWPWGQGFRENLPNLTLMRGSPAWVESDQMAVRGLARLGRYKVVDRGLWRGSLDPGLNEIATRALIYPASLIVFDRFARFRTVDHVEEMLWLARRIDDQLLGPLMEAAHQEPIRIVLVAPPYREAARRPELAAPAAQVGLGLEWISKIPMESTAPFDERALEHRSLPKEGLHDVVDTGLRPIQIPDFS